MKKGFYNVSGANLFCVMFIIFAHFLAVYGDVEVCSPSDDTFQCASSGKVLPDSFDDSGGVLLDDDVENNLKVMLGKQRQFYINGSWVDPLPFKFPSQDSTVSISSDSDSDKSDEDSMEVKDPSTDRTVAQISLASRADVDAAVQAAQDALVSWSLHTSPEERYGFIENLLERYRERSEEMARLISMEMGAPIELARSSQVGAGEYAMEQFLYELDTFEFEYVMEEEDHDDYFEYDSVESTTIFMEPVGVVALITPWNWPMNQIVLKAVPALAVGCTVILKPSEMSPLSATLFTQLVHEAGFPSGVFNLVHGVGDNGPGEFLVRHPGVDAISFTGSTRVGKFVSVAAADTLKKVSLELGGKGAFIVFADAVVASESEDENENAGFGDGYDYHGRLEDLITEGVYGCFVNSGQTCNAPTRMLVEAPLYDEAVAIARRVALSVRVKPANDEGNDDDEYDDTLVLGPVVSRAQYERVQDYIRRGVEEGARLVAGGTGKPADLASSPEFSNGHYVRPTVFADVTPSMTIAREEIFGPVLCILPFMTEEEALEIANDTPYGLANYIHTSDPHRRRRMARGLRSGMVETNGIPLAAGSPFGGIKASGNGSREGGGWGLEDFCEVKAVSGL